jgi:hypothetical protein
VPCLAIGLHFDDPHSSHAAPAQMVQDSRRGPPRPHGQRVLLRRHFLCGTVLNNATGGGE